MLIKTLILWAAITLALAVLNAVFIFIFPGGTILWNLSRLLVSVFIICFAFLTWRALSQKVIQASLHKLVFVCSIVLVAIGIAGFINAIYLGRTTGDFEYYLFPIHALLIGQGALTYWYLQMSGRKLLGS